ncbi:MAG: mechanosensitive ion channel family protein [Polyangiaceae bacterium]
MKRLAPTFFCVLLLIPAVAQAQTDPPNVEKILGFVRWTGVLVSLGVIVGAGLLVRFINNVVVSLGDRFTNRRLTFQKIESFLRFAIYIITGAVVIALSFRLTDAVLTLVGGTLAVAIGFAMRDLVAAMIAGVTIMLDRPFQVGDRVQFSGEYGDITAIGLRSVRIQTLDDNTVTIPNNKLLTDVTSCGNYGALDMQIQIDFYIGVDQDIALAERILREAMLTSQYVYLKKPIVVLVKQVLKDQYVAIHLRLKGYVLDTKHEKAFETDVSKRALLAFREHGVMPPAVLHRQIEERPLTRAATARIREEKPLRQ